MQTRRGFLRWTTGGAAWLLAGRRMAAATVDPEDDPDAAHAAALAIHRATRNTRLGAVGTRLRSAIRAPRQPWKPYPGRPRAALPDPGWESGRPLFAVARRHAPGALAGGTISREELSRLLLLANGITGRQGARLLRAAPSAGALYAGEVYLVAAGVEGLAPGVYYYAVRDHALVRLREGPAHAEVAGALERPAQAAGAAAALLLTNVFDRYRVRYANRGYRYALIDSGHIGENLRLAAAELDLAERAPRRWEDRRLNRLLGVDGRGEAVCAVHLLGRPGPGAAPGADAPRALEEAGEAPASSPPTQAYHLATALRPAEREDAPSAGSGPAPRAPAGPVDADDPVDDAPATPVHEAIRVRRSTRRFEPGSAPLGELMRVLELARGLPALARGPELELHVVAHRVADLAPGLYRYDAGARRLEPRRPGTLAGDLEEAALGQRKTGEAAAALVGVARLAEAAARGGARSYRDLLLEAGATAQRIYLAAEAQGLTARNLAAYYDDELDSLLDLDGASEVAVHLTAVGRGD